MELKTLKCPNCGADLEIEDGIDTFYCKYCGHKIVLEGQSDAAYEAKAKVKEIEHEEKKQKANLDYKKFIEKNDNATSLKMISGLLLFIVGCFVFLQISGNRQAAAAAKQTEKFEKIENQVVEEIKNGDYDAALADAQMLRDTTGTLSGIARDALDQKREDYIATIEELRQGK